MATTQSPTRRTSESPKTTAGSLIGRLDLEHGDVGLRVAADQLGRQPGVVMQNHGDLVGVLDDVVVRHDIAAGVDDESGAQRGGALLRMAGWLRSKNSLKNSSNGEPGGKPGISMPGWPSSDWVVEMLTTAGSSASARSAKLSGGAFARAGAVTISRARTSSDRASAWMPRQGASAPERRGRRPAGEVQSSLFDPVENVCGVTAVVRSDQ